MSYLYLATPYSHPDLLVREYRAWIAAVVVGAFYMHPKAIVTYSPIVHCHPVTSILNLPEGYNFWKKFDVEMIKLASGIVNVRLYMDEDPDGFDNCASDFSWGMNAELALANLLGIREYKLVLRLCGNVNKAAYAEDDLIIMKSAIMSATARLADSIE